MATKQHFWFALSLAALSSSVGCSTTGSLWPSTGWFGAKTEAPANNLAQQNARNTTPAKPSIQGANAQLGAPSAEAAGPFAAMTASFKKWTGNETAPPPADDPLSLDSKPKQLSPDFYTQIAHMHEAKGDFDGAIKLYEQALKASPQNTDVLVSMARAYDRQGNMVKAIETYQRAIKIDARCALAHNDLGLCYARQNDVVRARESLNKAVALVPTSKLYRNNLATILVAARQYNEAYEQLSSVYPPAIAHYNVGVLTNRRGNRAEALSRFQQASAADPNLAQARNMIDKLNGVAQQPTTPPALAEQARQYQTGIQGQARQVQNQWRNEADRVHADLKTQVDSQTDQLKAQVSQTQNNVANRVQSQATRAESQVNSGVNQTNAAAQTAIRDAEAKIRAVVQPQIAPIEPQYGSGWVPPQTDDITPIRGVNETETGYTFTDDGDDMPVLLPPTGE